MNKSPLNWVTILSLGSAFCAFIVIIANANTQLQFSGIFALLSLLLAMIAAPLSFKKTTQRVRIKTSNHK